MSFCLIPAAKVVSVPGTATETWCGGMSECRIPTCCHALLRVIDLAVVRFEPIAARPLSCLCPRTGIKFFIYTVKHRYKRLYSADSFNGFSNLIPKQIYSFKSSHWQAASSVDFGFGELPKPPFQSWIPPPRSHHLRADIAGFHRLVKGLLAYTRGRSSRAKGPREPTLFAETALHRSRDLSVGRPPENTQWACLAATRTPLAVLLPLRTFLDRQGPYHFSESASGCPTSA